MSRCRTSDCKAAVYSVLSVQKCRISKVSLKIIAWITRSYARATLAVSQTPVSCLPRPHFVRHSRFRRQLTRNALITPLKRGLVVFETPPLWRRCAYEASFTVNGQPMRIKQLYTQNGAVVFLLLGHLFLPRCEPLFELGMQY